MTSTSSNALTIHLMDPPFMYSILFLSAGHNGKLYITAYGHCLSLKYFISSGSLQ